MRFVNFQLLSYPQLPEDFTENYESVWVTVEPRLHDGAVSANCFNNAIDLLVEAAELGFDAVGANEHHNCAYAMTPSPNLMVAMLARETKDVAIMPLGNSLALYNPPLRVAEEMAMLDVFSRGRLIAGLPVGTAMDTAYAYSVNPSELRARYLEAHDLIMKAWTADDVFSFNGRFNKLRYVNIWPRPIQKPPPGWVPGAGTPETWDFCCEHNHLYAYLTTGSYYKISDVINGYWERVKAHSLEPNPFRAATSAMVAIADNYTEAKRLYSRAADYFFNRAFHVHPRFTSAPGYFTEGTIRKLLAAQKSAGRTNNFDIAAATFDEVVDRGDIIAGNPDEVTEKLQAMAEEARVGNVVTITSYGDMPADLASYNTRMFAEKVMPNLQGLYEDQWEHKWWPETLRDRPNLRRPATVDRKEVSA